MTLKVQIVAPEAIKAAVDKLREVDKDLPGRMRLLLRRVAQPIMREQRRLIRNMPVKGPRSTNLRREIARGVRLRLRTGKDPIMRIRTHIVRKKGGILPRGLDTFFGGFRGGPKAWPHHQNGYGPSWFMGPPASHQKDAEKKIRDLLEMSAQEVRNAAAKSSKRGRPTKGL